MKGKVVVSTNTGVIKTAEKQTPETIDTSFETNTNTTQLPTSNITADDFATAADTGGAPDTEGISFKVQLKPYSSKILADQGWYELAKSINGITNSSAICSSTTDCKFVLTEGKMNPNIIGFDEYTFSGRVKITMPVDDDVSRSKFYDIDANLKVFEEKTNGSKAIRFLQGDLNLEPGALDYQITKALLFSDNKRKLTLTVEAEGTPSENGIDTSSADTSNADTSSADTSSGNILKNTDKTADNIMNQADKTIEKINKLFK